jgi:hypothetical protein
MVGTYRNIGIAALIALASPVWAQTGQAPANLPPASFDGREFVDTAGCTFLRSTFGGQVTWVPRFGPDRQPICGQSPTEFAAAQPDPTPPPAVQPVMQPAGSVARPAPTPQPVVAPAPRQNAARAPAARTAPRATPRRPTVHFPQPDSMGRHPSCPPEAAYGQLVPTELGRPLVRCVASPSLLLPDSETVRGPVTQPISHAQAPRHGQAASRGARVQVGSFGVPSNATRLQSRLRAAGFPVRISHARGLQVVSIGPFASGAQAQAALNRVRAMGFRDAFLTR